PAVPAPRRPARARARRTGPARHGTNAVDVDHSLIRHYAPDRVREIVRDNERAARIYRHAHRAAACRAVAVAEPGNEVHGRARGPAVAKRHEHDFVASGLAAIPAAVLANEHA